VLILVAFLFVLAAVALRVVGAVMDDGLAFTYASIGCSVIAGILILAAVRNKPPPPIDPPS
jgi:hypothetical protein